MNITVDWYDEDHTIVYWEFAGRWTWQDYATAQQESNTLLATIDGLVDIIGNLEQSPGLPANALSAYKNFLKRSAPNTGLIVLVRYTPFIKAMVQIFTRFTRGGPGTDFAFADTLEEALALIRARQQERQAQRG